MYFDEAKLTYLSISRYDGSEVAPRNSCCEENGSFNEIAAYKAYFDYQERLRTSSRVFTVLLQSFVKQLVQSA